MASKPRIMLGPRDLVWSLIPLVLICVVFAGLASQCRVSPGGPTAGPVPSFDAKDALAADAARMSFPIRNPQLPPGWKPNSGSRSSVGGQGGGQVSTVGYVTTDGRYLAFTQSNAEEEALVRSVDSEATATGTEKAAGRTWVVYGEPGRESIWVADLGGVRVLLRGAGSHKEYTQLAEAVVAAKPLPRS